MFSFFVWSYNLPWPIEDQFSGTLFCQKDYPSNWHPQRVVLSFFRSDLVGEKSHLGSSRDRRSL